MNNTELKELIEDCCNDVFDKLEPLANVKSRLYESLKPAISVTQCCTELQRWTDNDVDAAYSMGCMNVGNIDDVAKELNEHVYSITFPIAVPFPGTAARTYAEKGEYGLKILTNDWDYYGKQYPGVMDSNVLSIDRLRALQSYAYEQIPKKNLDEFLHLRSQQA